MDSSAGWQSSLPNRSFDPNALSQPAPFPSNISSYFRRPAKVVKTGSRGNSPKNLSRRRTTASHSTRHRTALNGSISDQNTVGGDCYDAAVMTRPISWHPNSARPTPIEDWMVPYQFPDSTYPPRFINSFTTTEVNGLVTPLTQPSSAESCYQEGFPPLEEMQFRSLDNMYPIPNQLGHGTFWPSQQNVAHHYAAHQPPMYRHLMTAEQETDSFHYSSARDVYTGTAPPTPDLLAISNDEADTGRSILPVPQSEGEVLVGMGLYDAPSPSNFALLHGVQVVLPHRASAGKGLKLEETFQPSNGEASDDDDGISADEAEVEVDELTQHTFTAPASQNSQPSAPASRPHVSTLADQSFFFDNEPDEDDLIQQAYGHDLIAPVWTDVYSGAPCQWI
jgi:hypothetical protein